MWREENVKRSRCPEKETPKDKDAKRKRKAAETTSVSRDSDDIMSRARNVKEKDSQEITQSTAVPARGSGAVPIGSPLSLLGSSLSRNFRHPACPGSTCIYIYTYIYICIFVSPGEDQRSWVFVPGSVAKEDGQWKHRHCSPSQGAKQNC